MGSSATPLAKRIFLLLLLVVFASAGCSRVGGGAASAPTAASANPQQDASTTPARAADATANPVTAVQNAPGAVPITLTAIVEIAPPAEAGPILQLPALSGSYGHRAGLHKVKDDLHLSASAALVIDQDTGRVLLHRNEDAVLPIASLTKLMTALVVTEAKLPMDEVISIADEDVDGERHSRSRLRVGTSLTRGDALQLALMASENRAAHALGRTFPAGLPAFVQAMNSKARTLGMKSTTYVEPTGLSTNNQSTARDLALVVDAASRNPLLAQYTTTRQHLLPVARGRMVQYNNSNRLVKNPRWEIALQKTGYIIEAGWCMVLDTRIAGRNLMVVLLDAGGAASRNADAERIRRVLSSPAKLVSDNAAGLRQIRG